MSDLGNVDAGVEEPPPLGRTTVRGMQLAGAGWGLTQALLFATYLVLARLVSPAEFGLYAAGTVITGVTGIFAESGMMAALISRKDRVEEAASTAFVSLFIGGMVLTLGSLVVSPLVGLFFGSSTVALISAAMSGWLMLRALTVVPDALLQRRFSFARRVAVDPLGAIAYGVASIALGSAGAGAWALVGGSYASMLVQVLSAWLFAGFRPRLRDASVSLWREMVPMARAVIASETVRRVASQIDALVLGRVSGAAALGQYRNALRLADQPTGAFVGAAAYVLFPAFARISGSSERMTAAVRRVYSLVIAIAMPISFSLIPLGVPGAVILLGDRWRPAGHALVALCGITLGATLISVASEIFKSVGRPGVLVRVQVFNCFAIAISVGIATPIWGFIGTAVAMSLSSLLAGAYAVVKVSPLVGLRVQEFALSAICPAVATAAMVLVMVLVGIATDPLAFGRFVAVLVILLEITIGAIVYVLVLIAIDRRRRGELERWLEQRQLIRLRRRRTGRAG